MIELKPTIRWNDAKILERTGLFKKAHAALDAQIIKDTDPFVPFKTGMTASSVVRSSTLGAIRYTTKYARSIYYGMNLNFNRAKHPQAGPKWFEKSKAIWLRRWNHIVKTLTRGR